MKPSRQINAKEREREIEREREREKEGEIYIITYPLINPISINADHINECNCALIDL